MQHLDVVVGVVAGAGGDRLEPVDVAVVVGAEQVDLLGEAAVLLAEVVGGVGGEVGGLTVGPDEHAVLVVGEVGGAQPDRAVPVEDVALLAQPLDGLLDGPAVVQLLLAEPHVEVHPEALEGPPDPGELEPVPEVAGHGGRLVGGQVEQVGAFGQRPAAELGDVLAGVPALGRLLTPEPGDDRGAELVHLGTGVVDVVLGASPRHRRPASSRAIASPSAAQRVWPMCRSPVGLAEMNSRLMTCPASESLRPKATPASTMAAGELTGGCGVEGDVEEAGPRDVDRLDAVDRPEPAGERRWRASRGDMPAPLASWRAMLVDQSPWSRFLGRSTRTSSGTVTARSPEATADWRAPRIAAESSSGVTRPSLRTPSGASTACREA